MAGIEPEDDERVHTEAPAEGDTELEGGGVRAHSEDAAEGPDED
ncbi:hypothetical protein J2W20_002092 [Sinomonas atrocyanea]|jgi:hypothetical protein|nr:hypothetical protein [Sinomonas atrocyanea]MDQ0260188.1 hypothetical protein [Sinomonas atrocyanea]